MPNEVLDTDDLQHLRAVQLQHAARLLAKSLTDAMIGSVRADWGKTNAAVLEHWRAEVLRLTNSSVI